MVQEESVCQQQFVVQLQMLPVDQAVDCASLDNMGNNESKDGVLPAKEGTSFTKFPTVEEERVTSAARALIAYRYPSRL